MATSYEQFQDEKIREIAKGPRILDIGGGARFQKWLQHYEPLFRTADYKTLDYDAATNPDIVGDIHALPLADASVDSILCYSVLEHVKDPGLAARELHRVLSRGGKLLLYVPSIYPYHARKGSYPDYWRFFDDTLLMLFADWERVELAKVGGYFKALSFFFPMQHKLQWLLSPLARGLDALFGTARRTTTSGYIVYAVK